MMDKESVSKSKRPSESMLRIMRLLRAKKFVPGDTLTYEISTADGKFKYAAKFQQGGRIADAEEVSAPVQPEEGAKFADVEWDSPTDFVNSMFDFAESRLPPKTRRGTLNGWSECFFNGQCLNDIFSSFLRQRTAVRSDEESEKQEKSSEKPDSQDDTTDGASTARLSSIPCKAISTSDPMESNLTSESASNQKNPAVDSIENAQIEVEKSCVQPYDSGSDKKDSTGKLDEDDERSDVKPVELEKKENTVIVTADDGDEANAMDTSADETNSAKKDNKEAVSQTDDQVTGGKGESNNVGASKESRSGEGSDKEGKDGVLEDSILENTKGGPKSKSGETDGEVVSSDAGSVSKVSDCSMDEEGKSKKDNSKTQKRKRSVTPQSDAERATRAKSRRRILDPEAAEAARVAAQADKLELKSLRPTTRLTSGKIPKVVYNASPRTMANESSEVLVEEPRSSRRKESSRRTPRKRSKNATAEESDGGGSDRDDFEMEVEEKNDTINLLKQLSIAVRRTGSTTPAVIVSELRGKSLSTEEARSFVTTMLDDIRRANTEMGHESEGSDVVVQMQAYIAAEIMRWESFNVKRPLSIITRRKTLLERKRPVLEKKRRRQKRSHDESMTKLEEEMDERRKNLSDGSKVACKLTITRIELEEARARRDTMQQKIEVTRKQDAGFRKRVDKTRKFYNQLLSVAKSSRSTNRGGPSGAKRRKLDSGTEITSEDERFEDSQGVGAGSEPKPEDRERMKEIYRLRSLVKARGTEAEEKQRQCQMMHLEVRALKVSKVRMDNTVYRRKTSRNNAARLMANGHSGHPSMAKKMADTVPNTKKANGGGRPRGSGGRGGRKKKENERTKTTSRKSGRPSAGGGAGN